MNFLVIILRLLHILSGVFWVGAALMLTFFISPTVGATKEAGQGFMRHFMGSTKFNLIMWTSAITTVLAGAILYWLDSDGFTSAWMHSGAGLGFGVGAFFGLIGLVFGMMVGKTNGALARLGSQIQGKPTPEQITQIGALRKRLSVISPINAYSLVIATLLMAIARYLRF